MRNVAVPIGAALLVLGCASSPTTTSPHAALTADSARFQVEHSIAVPVPEGAKEVRIWLPLPRIESEQDVADLKIDAPPGWRETKDKAGNRYVYDKNPNYVPRAEPPSGISGGKVVKLDRVIYENIADEQTAMAALQSGEIDFYEVPPIDLLPQLEGDSNIKLQVLSELGNVGWLRAWTCASTTAASSWLSLKMLTVCERLPACSWSDCAAAEASSTSAAFCCVTWSICVIAWLICSMPWVCSWLAAVISPMMSVTRFTLSPISSIVRPASATCLLPSSTVSTESPIWGWISLAAAAERCARLRQQLFVTNAQTTRVVRATRARKSIPPLHSRRRGRCSHPVRSFIQVQRGKGMRRVANKQNEVRSIGRVVRLHHQHAALVNAPRQQLAQQAGASQAAVSVP